MRHLTIARCTIANEVLRRRNYADRDTTVRPSHQPGYRAALITVSLEEPPAARTQVRQRIVQGSVPAGSARLPTTDAEGSPEATGIHAGAFDGTNAGPVMHCRKTIRLRRGLDADERNNHICEALGHWKDASAQSLPHQAASASRTVVVERERELRSQRVDNITATTQQKAHPLEHDFPHTTVHYPMAAQDLKGYRQFEVEQHLDILLPYSHTARDSRSPKSDITLYEEPNTYSLSQLKESKGIEGTENHVKMHEHLPLHVPKRRAKHQRELSIDTTWSTVQTLSMPLRTRGKTKDGMLQFKANASKDSSSSFGSRDGHRRKVSLNLPVITSISPPKSTRPPESSINRPELSARPLPEIKIRPKVLTEEERELEYKHRHTFIGTASLDDFLELLEVNPKHYITRYAILKAFILLSSTEQLHARQCSTHPEGWELVTRTTPDLINADYVAQLQTKLGSITLRQFLDLIPFDEKDEVCAYRVVQSFLAASHIDAQADVALGSKARAFRSWMVHERLESMGA